MKDDYPKECRFDVIGLSIEIVVVVLDYAVNAARYQGNIESEPSSSMIRHDKSFRERTGRAVV